MARVAARRDGLTEVPLPAPMERASSNDDRGFVTDRPG